MSLIQRSSLLAWLGILVGVFLGTSSAPAFAQSTADEVPFTHLICEPKQEYYEDPVDGPQCCDWVWVDSGLGGPPVLKRICSPAKTPSECPHGYYKTEDKEGASLCCKFIRGDGLRPDGIQCVSPNTPIHGESCQNSPECYAQRFRYRATIDCSGDGCSGEYTIYEEAQLDGTYYLQCGADRRFHRIGGAIFGNIPECTQIPVGCAHPNCTDREYRVMAPHFNPTPVNHSFGRDCAGQIILPTAAPRPKSLNREILSILKRPFTLEQQDRLAGIDSLGGECPAVPY